MQINGPGPIHGAAGITPANSVQGASSAGASQSAASIPTNDEVSISPQADLMSRIGELPEVRQELVDQLRTEIAEGSYETEEKLDIAVSRLLDEIA